MAIPANPDTLTKEGATIEEQDGGLFNTTTGTTAVALKSTIGADLTAAEAAKVAAEAAQTAAEAAQTAAETAETNAETAETNAETAETNADSHRVEARLAMLDAQKLATNAEDSQYTLQASPNTGTTGYSALHYAAKAEDDRTLAQTAKTDAVNAKSDAVDAKNDAEKLAIQAEDSQFTLSDGSTTGYSALHYNAKAQAAKTAAETAKTSAEQALDDFDDIYLGEKSANPTLDNDGDALQTGALYFNNQNNRLYVYTGSNWISANPEIVGDTSPQLGGNLDLNSKAITGTGHLEPLGGTTYTPPSGSGSDTSTVTAIALTRGREISVGYNGFVRSLLAADTSGNIVLGDGSTGLFSNILLQPGSNQGVKLGFNGANYKLETTNTGASVTGDLAVSGNTTITGDLTVNGTQTSLNTATLTVDDLNITVADGAANAAAADGAGLTVDGANATITYVNSGDKWAFNKPLDVTGSITSSSSITGTSISSSGTITATGAVTAASFSGDGSSLTNLPVTGDGGIAMAIALG